ncbi:MAG: hypothetical protein ACOX2Q_01140 [Dehalobacterium sp.]
MNLEMDALVDQIVEEVMKRLKSSKGNRNISTFLWRNHRSQGSL